MERQVLIHGVNMQSRRLGQNRVAARKSRQRRKEYVEHLEEEVWLAHAASLCCACNQFDQARHGPTDVRACPEQQLMHGNVCTAALYETTHDNRCRRHAAEVGQQISMPCTLHCIACLNT